ncbi:hypothetical protein TNIN_16931 [Trichonephila inaurata madagascariensis]|uniref:Uncharacterized protein n=1 Tax=Trichonephila inaurata madagascariensis TaxID=2747483 RepID=A0A8X6Y175_9ARAC|nr:hypothetical protein TNIN_16931 [Trichonephila inaurata madagascariensis]
MFKPRPRTSGNGDGFPATARPSDPHWPPNFAGNDTRKKSIFFPLFPVRYSLSNTLARILVFNLHTEASDEVEEGVGTFRHTLNPFRGNRKGVPCQRASVEVIAEVAYIKVAPVSGLCEMTRGFFWPLFPQNSLQPDHGHQEMLDGLPRNSSVLQTPHWTPTSRGTTQVEKYRFTPFCSSDIRFPTL